MKKPNSNQVRIIAGSLRGRKIHFLSEEGLRPTADRLRETLFNWLAPIITNTNCLDLFAGSGALGIEAISRGADFVTFVDANTKACQAIQENLQRLTISNASVIQQVMPSQLSLAKPVDVIFLDPPFQANLFQEILLWLTKQDFLKPETLIYLETPKIFCLQNIKGFSIYKSTRVGLVQGSLLKHSHLYDNKFGNS